MNGRTETPGALDAFVEALRRGQDHMEGIDPATAAAARELYALARESGPRPGFLEALERRLVAPRVPLRRRDHVPRRLVAGLAAALVLVVGLAATRPEAVVAAGRSAAALLHRLWGPYAGVVVPTNPRFGLILGPEPPFAVYEPSDLPAGLTERRAAYSLGPGPAGPTPPPGQARPVATTPLLRSPAEYERRGLLFDRRRPYLVVHYQGPGDDRELVVLMRIAALDDAPPAGEPFRLLDRGGTLAERRGGWLASAVVGATWVQLWTNLGPNELERAAGQLRQTYPEQVTTLDPTWRLPATPGPPRPTGAEPAFLRPSYVPPPLDNASYGVSAPPGGLGARLPEPWGDTRGRARAEVIVTPVAQRVNWEWLRASWRVLAGGQITIHFIHELGGYSDAYLELEVIGPARVDAPGGTQVTTPGGRAAVVASDPAGVGVLWRDGSAVPRVRRDSLPAGDVLLYQHADTVVRVQANLPRAELLRFVDGLVVE